MATIPGGIATTVSNDPLVLAAVDQVLITIGVTDSTLSTVISGASVTGGGTFVQPTSTSTNSTAVIGSVTSLTTVQLGGAQLVINPETSASNNKPVVVVEGSKVASSGSQLQTIVSSIADNRLPDTDTGRAIVSAVGNAVTNLSGNTNKNLVVTQVSNTDGRDTVSVTGGANDVVVLSTGNTGTKLNVSATSVVIVGNSEQVTLTNTGGSSANLVSFNGRITGSTGADTVASGSGTNANISGGLGNDTFRFNWENPRVVLPRALESDGTIQAATATTKYLKSSITISDFSGSQDKLNFNIDGVTNFTEFKAILATAKQVGSDVVATTLAGDKITLTGVNISTLTEDMFTFG